MSKATVSIDLGMVRKLVMVACVRVNVCRTEVRNGHSGEQIRLDGLFSDYSLLWTQHSWDGRTHTDSCRWMHCVMSPRWMLSEGGRQRLFDLDRMRKCAPVMHAGETLVIFSLTESDWEANAITERHAGMASVCFPLPSEHYTQWSFSSPIREFIWQSYPWFSQWGKIDLATYSSEPSWIRQRGENEALSGHTTPRFTFVPKGEEFISVKSLRL